MIKEYQKILQERAHLQIGKNGISQNLIDHLQNLFKHQKLLKIKIMPDYANYHGMENILTELIEKIPIFIYDVRGFTAIISKRNFQNLKPKKKYLKLLNNSFKRENNLTKSRENIDNKTTISPILQKSYEDAPYINYDDPEQLAEIDELSEEIYKVPKKKKK